MIKRVYAGWDLLGLFEGGFGVKLFLGADEEDAGLIEGFAN